MQDVAHIIASHLENKDLLSLFLTCSGLNISDSETLWRVRCGGKGHPSMSWKLMYRSRLTVLSKSKHHVIKYVMPIQLSNFDKYICTLDNENFAYLHDKNVYSTYFRYIKGVYQNSLIGNDDTGYIKSSSVQRKVKCISSFGNITAYIDLEDNVFIITGSDTTERGKGKWVYVLGNDVIIVDLDDNIWINDISTGMKGKKMVHHDVFIDMDDYLIWGLKYDDVWKSKIPKRKFKVKDVIVMKQYALAIKSDNTLWYIGKPPIKDVEFSDGWKSLNNMKALDMACMDDFVTIIKI